MIFFSRICPCALLFIFCLFFVDALVCYADTLIQLKVEDRSATGYRFYVDDSLVKESPTASFALEGDWPYFNQTLKFTAIRQEGDTIMESLPYTTTIISFPQKPLGIQSIRMRDVTLTVHGAP